MVFLKVHLRLGKRHRLVAILGMPANTLLPHLSAEAPAPAAQLPDVRYWRSEFLSSRFLPFCDDLARTADAALSCFRRRPPTRSHKPRPTNLRSVVLSELTTPLPRKTTYYCTPYTSGPLFSPEKLDPAGGSRRYGSTVRHVSSALFAGANAAEVPSEHRLNGPRPRRLPVM